MMSSQTWEEKQSVSEQELRAALLMTACNLKEDNCTQQAKDLFKQYINSNGTYR